jgi:hypothetical protein
LPLADMIEDVLKPGLPQEKKCFIEKNTLKEAEKKNLIIEQHPESCFIIDEKLTLSKNEESALKNNNKDQKNIIFACSQNKFIDSSNLEHNKKAKNASVSSNKDTALNEVKLSASQEKELKSFEPTQNNPIKPIKKVSKRYQELLENSILNFDKPRKEKICFTYVYAPNIEKKKKNNKTKPKVPKSKTESAKKNQKKEKIKITKNEVDLPGSDNEKENSFMVIPNDTLEKSISAENFSQIQKMDITPTKYKNIKKLKGKKGKKILEENLNNDLYPSMSNFILSPSFEKINHLLDKNLTKIYSEVRDVRFLGKKRNSRNSESDQVDSEILPIPFKKIQNNFKEIKFKKYQESNLLHNKQNTENLIKHSFFNEDFAKELKNSISVLQEGQMITNNKNIKCKNNFNSIFLQNIPNPFDESLRRHFASTLDFIKHFQDEYAPIQMQKENEKIFQTSVSEINLPNNMNKGKSNLLDSISVESGNFSTISNTNNSNSVFNSSTQLSKTHFIKKKQSALNIKRQCGVSYVVPSESKQINVEKSYKSLGHLVYQGTHSINQISEENLEILNYLENLINQELMNNPLIITTFESPDEDEMKEYLLCPEKRLKIAKEIFIVESLDEIWKFSKDRLFLCVHLLFDPKKGVRNFTLEEIKKLDPENFLTLSNIQIGFLFRKATCGIKSVLKLYKSAGLDKNDHPATFKICNINLEEDIDSTIEKLSGSNMSTLSMRVELYAPEKAWKKSNLFTKEFLYTFMCLVEEKITKLILNWNDYRYLMHSLTKDDKIKEYIKNLQFLIFNLDRKFDTDGPKNVFKNDYFDISNSNFNLQKVCLENFIRSNNLEDKSQSQNFKKFETFQGELKDLFIIKDKNPLTDISPIINNVTFHSPPLPMYIISTRDCFVFDLNIEVSEILFENKIIIKKEFFFDSNNVPSNFHKFKTSKDDLRVGVVTYENFYNHDELQTIERLIENTEEFSLKDAFLPETAQKTFAGEKLKRTKFFFGSRYMWTKKQLSEPNSYVAAGIRKDVSPAPYWMKEKIEYPLVKAGIVLKDFINSFALNIYHDGSEGLGQHFDDAVRFKQV